MVLKIFKLTTNSLRMKIKHRRHILELIQMQYKKTFFDPLMCFLHFLHLSLTQQNSPPD